MHAAYLAKNFNAVILDVDPSLKMSNFLAYIERLKKLTKNPIILLVMQESSHNKNYKNAHGSKWCFKYFP